MPYCAVPKCSNSWKKNCSMYRLPTNMERRQQWITNIGRLDLDLTKVYFICEAHFSVEMWEKPRIDGKKKLKNTAVPTIFQHKGNENIIASIDVNSRDLIFSNAENNIQTTNHEDLSNNIEEMESLLKDIDEPCISLINSIQNEDMKKTPIPEATISVPSLLFTAVDRKKLMEEVKESKLQLQKANVIIKKLDKSKGILMKRVKRLIHEKRKLTAENQILKQTKNFKGILNNDQVKALSLQSVRGHKWSTNTIKKALRLKLACGSSGYQELMYQGIPLPSQRTLRRRLQDIDFKPGICEQIFDMIKQHVSQLTDDREKDCMLAIDEMSIMAGEQIDQSTMSHFGLSTLPDTLGNYNVPNYIPR